MKAKSIPKEVITFKVDPGLAKYIKSLPNSSDFIRDAVLQAMKHTCPLCKGKGTMTQDEMNHLNTFLKSHSINECAKCNANIIKCRK